MPNQKKKDRKRYTARSSRSARNKGQSVKRLLVSATIIVVVLATVFFLVLRNHSQISIAENAIGSLLSPVQNALSTAANSVKSFVSNWRNYDQLQDDYDVLYRENQQLSLELGSAEEAVLENERLKALLDAKSSYETLDPVYAKVIAREAGQWFTTFSINRGEMHGISAGMAVVNGDGLIGRVYETGLNYAKVITIISPDSRLSCLIQSTRENGILRGGISNEMDEAVCYVNYLPSLNSIVPGDVVVTSGTDSVYPKGLNIGTVTEVSLSAGSEGSYAVVKPAVDFLRIEEVLVLRDVVEKDTDGLSPVPTATPAPTATPSPTPAAGDEQPVSPNTTEGNYVYPTAGADTGASPTPGTGKVEPLPEDAWVDQ